MNERKNDLYKQAETTTREIQAKLEAALTSMTDAVFISDVDGKFVDFNDAFASFHRFKNKAECATWLSDYSDILEVFMDNGELAPLDMWAVPRALRGETVTNAEYTLRRKDTGETWVGSYNFSPIRNEDGVITGSVVVGRDITERKHNEKLLSLQSEVLKVLISDISAIQTVEKIVDIIKKATGHDAVGVRLRVGSDYPFVASLGYSEEFLKAENTLTYRYPDGGLCRNDDGTISLECTCGMIISGKSDPNNPLLTSGGSVWTNNSLPFLDVPPDADPRLHPRNRCIHVGFLSLALIPIRTGADVLGLLHLADLHQNSFTPETILFYEGIGLSIGVALSRKKANEALHEQKELLTTMFAQTTDAIVLVDFLAMRFIDFNEAAHKGLGYTQEEFSRLYVNDIQADLTPEMIASYSQQAIKEELNIPLSYHRHKDGSLRIVSLKMRPVNFKGKPIISVVWRDITEEKKAEEALRLNEEKYRLSFENVTDVIYTIDTNLNISSVSPSVKGLLGYKPEDFIGRPVSDLENILKPESFQQAIADTSLILKGETIPATVYQFIAKDGTIKYGEVSGSPLMHDGKIMGIISVARDITERKQAEEKLQQTLDSLRNSVGATIQVMVSAVEMIDPYTAGHQIRVADLACAIAAEMGLPRDKIEGIRMAGSIHDIGKLSIPAEILTKPNKLTDIEFSLIKEHSRSGYEMLKDVESHWPLAQIVYQHHERMDGSGYPRNLKGDEILMEARIMAVSDVVEAMASHRPYRPGLGMDAALVEIEKNRGILYDNTVADACLRLFREKGYQLK